MFWFWIILQLSIIPIVMGLVIFIPLLIPAQYIIKVSNNAKFELLTSIEDVIWNSPFEIEVETDDSL